MVTVLRIQRPIASRWPTQRDGAAWAVRVWCPSGISRNIFKRKIPENLENRNKWAIYRRYSWPYQTHTRACFYNFLSYLIWKCSELSKKIILYKNCTYLPTFIYITICNLFCMNTFIIDSHPILCSDQQCRESSRYIWPFYILLR